MAEFKPHIVIVEDHIVTAREYVTMAKDEEDAKENVLKKQQFIIESEAVTTDCSASRVIRCEQLESVVENISLIENNVRQRPNPQEILDEANRFLERDFEPL